MKFHACGLCIVLVLLAPLPASGACVVEDVFAVRALPPPLPEVPAGTAQETHPISRFVGVLPPGFKPREKTPEEEQLDRINAAIRRHDLAGFIALMPSDPSARNALLRKSHSIGEAAREGSLPIVRQIIEWQPRALAERDRKANSFSLWDVTRSWNSAFGASRRGEPGRAHGSEKDHLELLRLFLDAGADPSGAMPSSQGSPPPLENVSGIGPSVEAAEAGLLLLRRGADVSGRTGAASLVAAARAGNVPIVESLLAKRPFTQDELDEALANAALTAANYKAVASLLERGADINADGERWSRHFFFPLWQASLLAKRDGYEDLLRLFIRYRADPNRKFEHTGDSALMNVMHRHDLMKALIELGADANAHNPETRGTALLLATRVPTKPTDRGSSAEVRSRSVAILLDANANPNSPDRDGVTALMQAGDDDEQSIRLLLERGATINLRHDSFTRYREGGAPLGPVSWAILQRKDVLAATMIAGNPRLDAQDCGAVFYAAGAGMTKSLRRLLDGKADAKVRSTREGMTPLIAAARYGQLGAVQALLDRGASDVDEATPVRMDSSPVAYGLFPVPVGRVTALMLAARNAHEPVVRELIRRGADVNQRDMQADTALGYSRDDATRAALLAAGARK